MKTKQDLNINILDAMKLLFFALLFMLAGCESLDEPAMEKEDGVQLSDKEITIDADGWKPLTESRATIFETQDDFLNDDPEAKGGGYFTMHAYLKETGATFIGGARAWYFRNDPKNKPLEGTWRFYDEKNNRFPEYYWPQNNSVDFFAYMPWSGSQRRKSITVGNYTQGTGLTINCTMQESTDLEDVVGQETIIAYTEDKSKEHKSVNMHFVHPFASVSFELMQAHRNLTIEWIRFNNVYLTGSTILEETTDNNTQISWTPPTGDPKTFTIGVNKIIPEDINFGAKIGGPYLVMPQSLSGATITIRYVWNNEKPSDDVITGDEDYNSEDLNDDKNKNNIYQITRPLSGSWLAGNKYNYVLNLGDNQEEILFKVEVEPWIPTGGNNNIFDIE